MRSALWSYKGGTRYSGISPFDTAAFTAELERCGHAVIETGGRDSNHRMIGVGIGHDDARFAETGTSHAAHLENGEAFIGRWFETEHGRRRYGVA